MFIFISITFLGSFTTEFYTKYEVLEKIDDRYKPHTEKVSNVNIEYLKYPIIIKPALHCHGDGFRVRKINNVKELNLYLKDKNLHEYIIQPFIDGDKEISVLYENGKIVDISERIFINGISYSNNVDRSTLNKDFDDIIHNIMKNFPEHSRNSRLDIKV